MAGIRKPPSHGRPLGARNKATVERERFAAAGLEEAKRTGASPLQVILARMRKEMIDGEHVTDRQYEAAVAAAPYLHPRLASSTVEIKDPLAALSDDDLRAWRSAIAARRSEPGDDAVH